MDQLYSNFESIYERISQASEAAGRSREEVTLIAVTKKQPISKIESYCKFCELNNLKVVIGENYVQEWEQKIKDLSFIHECHLIGHLQSNKVKNAVANFSSVQTVDSEKLIESLNKEASRNQVIYPVWLQVNISQDSGKFGCNAIDVDSMIDKILSTKQLKFEGLMTITKDNQSLTETRKDFNKLYNLGESLKQNYRTDTLGVDTMKHGTIKLSMGMSSDFEAAILEGATHIRLGSALFGAR